MGLISFVRSIFDIPSDVKEMGEVATTPGGWAYNDIAENPSVLLRTKGLSLIDDMRIDDALGAFVDIKKSARLSTEWKIVAASDEPDDIEKKEFVEYVIEQIPGSLKERLREILSAMEYGYSITNKPLYVIDGGPFSGKIGIWNLKTKEPHNYKFKLDKYRNIEALIHTNPETKDEQPLKPNDFIVYSYRKEFHNPYGTSDFIRAHRAWNSKRHIMAMWDMYIERFAGGFLDISYAAGKQSADEHAVMKSMINDIQTPRTGVLHSNVYTIKLQETQGRGNDIFTSAIADRNKHMARAVLIPDLLGFSAAREGGAYAQAKKHFDVFLQVIEELGKDIEQTIMGEQFIKPLIDLNYPNTEAYPRFAFEPLSDDQKSFVITNLITAVEKGVVTPDPGIEAEVRKMLDLPPQEDQDEVAPSDSDDDIDEDDDGAAAPSDRDASTRQVVPLSSYFQKPTLNRTLTSAEKKVNFTAIISFIEQTQPDFVAQWESLYKNAEKTIVEAVAKKKIIDNADFAAMNALVFPRKMDMQKSLARFMLLSFYEGALQAQHEIRDTSEEFDTGQNTESHFAKNPMDTPLDEIEKLFTKRGLVISPAIKQAAAAIKREAFFVTGIQSEAALSKTKQVIYRGIRRRDLRWTERELKKLFDGFIQRGVVKDGVLGELHRIETIARTNFSTAINEGRLQMFNDPAIRDYIVAYQYSAVLDDATTAYCEAMDGTILRKEDMAMEGFPPAHYNCRSLVIPITQGESFEFGELPRGIQRGNGFTSSGDLSCCSMLGS